MSDKKKDTKKQTKDIKKTTVKKTTVKKTKDPKTVVKQTNKQVVNIKINTNDIKKKSPEKQKPKKPVDNKPINENWSLDQKKRFSSKNRPNNNPVISSNASVLLNEIMAKNGSDSLYNKQTLEAKDKYKSRLTESSQIVADNMMEEMKNIVFDTHLQNEFAPEIKKNQLKGRKPKPGLTLEESILKHDDGTDPEYTKIIQRQIFQADKFEIENAKNLEIFKKQKEKKAKEAVAAELLKTPKATAPEMIDFGTHGKVQKLGISPMKPPLFANPVNYPISNISMNDLYEKGGGAPAGIVKNTNQCSVCKKNNDNSDRAYGHNKATCSYYKEGGKFKG